MAGFLSALMLLGACGATGAENRPSSSPSGDGTASASASGACTNGARSVCVTAGADGRTITLRVGWTLGVDLHAPHRVWSAPSALGGGVLRQIGAIRRDGGAVRASYRTVAPGRAELRAFERPVCPPARACPQFIIEWQVHIRVTGR